MDQKRTEKETEAQESAWRRRWWPKRQPKKVPPPPATMDDALMTPEFGSGIISTTFFSWVAPLIEISNVRSLEDTDVYRLPARYLCDRLAPRFEKLYQRRQEQDKERNRRLDEGSWKPWLPRRLWWRCRSAIGLGWKDGRERGGFYVACFTLLPWDTWGYTTIFRLLYDLATIFTPFLLRYFIVYCSEAYDAARGVDIEPALGRGIAFVVGIWLMFALGCLAEFQWVNSSLRVSLLLRGTLISSIFRQAAAFDHRERNKWTVGKLMTLMTSDVNRIDYAANQAPSLWAAPLRIIIICALLTINIGVSALAGIAFILLIVPANAKIVVALGNQRRAINVLTEQRVSTTQEVMSSIHTIKTFSWEEPYQQKIASLRKREASAVRRIVQTHALATTLSIAAPPLAAVASFLVYAALHDGDIGSPANIFSSFALFQWLQSPLELLPMIFSAIVDVREASKRIEKVYNARTAQERQTLAESSPFAIDFSAASFQWDSSPSQDAEMPKRLKSRRLVEKLRRRKQEEEKSEPAIDLQTPLRPFALSGIDLKVKRGQLVAVVGPVASGKSSLCGGLLGHMTRMNGYAAMAGKIAYCSQIPWIQSVTIKENILFGKAFDEKRYRRVLEDCCLAQDIALLPAGDSTVVGERGVTLSGGQKQRLSLARAVHYDTDILLLDDPLSACDAIVGHRIFQQAIKGRAKGKTVLLITHALHLLPAVDHIVTLDNGRIAETGTYNELMASKGVFSDLVADFVSTHDHDGAPTQAIEAVKEEAKATADRHELMSEEERKHGRLESKVYVDYLRAAQGWITLPALAVAFCLAQASTILGVYSLLWFRERTYGLSTGAYLALIAAFAVAQVLFILFVMVVSAYATIRASRRLHDGALQRLLRAPMAFFNINPLGRIIARLTSDVDILDQSLGRHFSILVIELGRLFSALVVAAILSPWLLLPMAVLGIACQRLAARYYPTARDVRRLRSLLRSRLYAHISETLTGIETITAFGESARIIARTDKLMDEESRAYMLQLSTRGWLATRAHLLGVLLYLAVCVYCLVERRVITPSQIGLTLSYFLILMLALSHAIQMLGQVENDLVSSERLMHYANNLEQEGETDEPRVDPPSVWPSRGALCFSNIMMRYRPELPLTIKGLSLDIKAGEKIGICGRTGAGKSSILHALLRFSELDSGSIELDGIKSSSVPLSALRRAIAIIPQDPVLLEGTLRTNLDPFHEVTDDATLWQALRRAGLSGDSSEKADPERRLLHLEAMIEAGGANLSVGERSLVSLARALVRDARIVLLDEATASVDYATDAKIQATIQSAFSDRTVLVIAHRIASICGCDRILVMDDGQAAELDAPLALFRARGIFYNMCAQSGIGESDVVAASGGRSRSSSASLSEGCEKA